jgi:energy-coupling factor transporter ATP-binding protein EcfA2
VLRDIDADLVPGQLIRVAGPNGCGKSTLLRLVCGASVPSRGRGMPLADGLGWSSAMLVPAVGWLTRAALTMEPGAARACAGTAGGPRRAQLATLLVALAGGVVLAVLGRGSTWPPRRGRGTVWGRWPSREWWPG